MEYCPNTAAADAHHHYLVEADQVAEHVYETAMDDIDWMLSGQNEDLLIDLFDDVVFPMPVIRDLIKCRKMAQSITKYGNANDHRYESEFSYWGELICHHLTDKGVVAAFQMCYQNPKYPAAREFLDTIATNYAQEKAYE